MIQTLFGSLKEEQEPEKKNIFERMRQAVTRTRDSLGERIDSVLALTRTVDESALEELEMSLIASDIGVSTSAEITGNLREHAKRQQIQNGAELKNLLKEQLRAILDENAAASGDGRCASGRDHDGWRQRHRQNDHEREAGCFLSRAGQRQLCCARRIPFAPRPSSSWKSGANAAASR